MSKAPKAFLSLSWQIVGKILRNKPLMIEMVFITIWTSVLILNLDFFLAIFESFSISVEIIRMICSPFSLINMLGVKLYNQYHSTVISKRILLIMLLSFLFLMNKRACWFWRACFCRSCAFSIIVWTPIFVWLTATIAWQAAPITNPSSDLWLFCCELSWLCWLQLRSEF